MILKYKKLNPDAMEPTRGSEYSAGLDLYSTDDYLIAPGDTIKIGIGIAVEIPQNHFGAIYARSGLATKKGLRPANAVGVVDADYRGELIVALHNDSSVIREIHKGERIAQLIVQPYVPAVPREADILSDTVRGEGGFGSTDKKDCIPNCVQTVLNDAIPENTVTFNGADYEV